MFSSFYLTKGACDQRLDQKLKRKLRVLCLHGFNTDKNVMEYQMRHFRQVFNEVIDFVVIDAPFECPEEAPRELQRFLKDGRTNFRSWLKFPNWQQDGGVALAPDVVFGLEEVVEYLADIMKTQGPFDGIFAFSQGGIIFRHFHRITQEIDPEAFRHPADHTKQTFQLPKFMITVASPVFPNMKFRYKNEEYSQRTTHQFNFPSIHLHGTQDNFKQYLTIHTLFHPASNAKVIQFNAGHRFPRQLPDDGFLELKQFVKDSYTQKNGSEEEFEVENTEYNFQVRIL